MAGTIASLRIALGLDTTGIGTGAAAAKQELTTLGTIAGVVGIALTAIAIGSAKAATDFQAELNTINTVAKVSDDQLATIGDDILDMSMKFGRSKDEITAGYYDLVSAQIKVKDAQDVLTNALQLGIGGLGTTKEAVDILTTAINTYGGDASKARQYTDELAMAVNIGKTTVHDLAEAYALVAPLAAQMGIGNDQLAASFGYLTEQGWKTTQVSFYMRQAMNALLKPTSDLDGLAARLGENFAAMARDQGLVATWQHIRVEAAKLGLSVEDLLGVQKGLVDENGLLKDGVDLNSGALAHMIGRVQGLQYVIATTGDNFVRYNAALDRVRRSTEGIGEAAVQAGLRNRGMQFSWDRLSATWDAVSVKLGNTLLPFLTAATDEINLVAGALFGLVTAFPAVTAVVFPLISALGLLMALNFGAKFIAMLLPLPYQVRTKLGNAIPDALAWVWNRAATSGPVLAAAEMAGAAASLAYNAAAFVGSKMAAAAMAAWAFVSRSTALIELAGRVGLDTGQLFLSRMFGGLSSSGGVTGSFLSRFSGIGSIVGKVFGIGLGVAFADIFISTIMDAANRKKDSLAYQLTQWAADMAKPAADAVDKVFGTDEVQKAMNSLDPFFQDLNVKAMTTRRGMQILLRETALDMLRTGKDAGTAADDMVERWKQVGPEIEKLIEKLDQTGLSDKERNAIRKQIIDAWEGAGKDAGDVAAAGVIAHFTNGIASGVTDFKAAGFMAGSAFWTGMELTTDDKGKVTASWTGDVADILYSVQATMDKPLELIKMLVGEGLPQDIAEAWVRQAPTIQEAYDFMLSPRADHVDKWFREAVLIAGGASEEYAKYIVEGLADDVRLRWEGTFQRTWDGIQKTQQDNMAARGLIQGAAYGQSLLDGWKFSVPALEDGLSNGVSNVLDFISNTFREGVDAMAEGIQQANARAATVNWINGIVQGYIDQARVLKSFYDLGASIPESIAQGGQDHVNDLIALIATLDDILKNGLTPHQVLWRLTGANIVDSIIHGMNSKKEGAFDAARNLISGQAVALQDSIEHGGGKRGTNRGIRAIGAEIPTWLAKGVTENEITAFLTGAHLGSGTIQAIWDIVHGKGKKGHGGAKNVGEAVPLQFADGVTNKGTGTGSPPYTAGTTVGNTALHGMNSVDYSTAGANAANEYWSGLITRISGLSPTELQNALWAKFGYLFGNNNNNNPPPANPRGHGRGSPSATTYSPADLMNNLSGMTMRHEGTLQMEASPGTLAAMRAAGFSGEDVAKVAQKMLVNVVDELDNMSSQP